MRVINFILSSCIVVCFFCLNSCDHGIEPPKENRLITGIEGTIFYSNWPPQDSVILLKLVIFKDFPPVDILSEVINGNAIVYPELLAETIPFGQDSFSFQVQLETGTYGYIAVAQQYGPDVFNDWRAVGQYDITPADSLPSSITVTQDSLLRNIDIFVDFNNLPIQPF